jgi:hypothetical protein
MQAAAHIVATIDVSQIVAGLTSIAGLFIPGLNFLGPLARSARGSPPPPSRPRARRVAAERGVPVISGGGFTIPVSSGGGSTPTPRRRVQRRSLPRSTSQR